MSSIAPFISSSLSTDTKVISLYIVITRNYVQNPSCPALLTCVRQFVASVTYCGLVGWGSPPHWVLLQVWCGHNSTRSRWYGTVLHSQ